MKLKDEFDFNEYLDSKEIKWIDLYFGNLFRTEKVFQICENVCENVNKLCVVEWITNIFMQYQWRIWLNLTQID